MAALNTLGVARKQGLGGAEILGAYSEGLFFAHRHKGAHNEEYFLPLKTETLDALIAAADGSLKSLALAPELDHADEFIAYLKGKGVRVMLGHTDADYEQTLHALRAGACGGVHVFNGMRGIHHRDPGCTGAVLMHPEAMVEVIADGVHVHPTILQMIVRLKGPERTALVSDCINAGGLPDGRYRLGKLDVVVDHGISRTLTGSLAGSTLTLDQAVANMTRLAGIELRHAINMASLVPARFLALDERLGSIAAGKLASMAVLDEVLAVQATWVRGRLIYCTPGFSARYPALAAGCAP